MVKIYKGRAGTGKTKKIMEEIKDAVDNKKAGIIMLVPEQYSHEAERELSGFCGASASLYAEVLSFTGLARKIISECGKAVPMLDKGGRLLCMTVALSSIYPRLKVYSAAYRKPEMQTMLISEIDELKSANISPEELYEAANKCPEGLADKLTDMAVIYEAYDSVVSNGRTDPSDRLTVLSELILKSGINSENKIYIDGFVSFTAQERLVIDQLIATGAEIVLCLTSDDTDSEVFALGKIVERQISQMASAHNKKIETTIFDAKEDKPEQLIEFENNMFSYSRKHYEYDNSVINLVKAGGMTEECEFAAAKCIELVRDEGCRWRDIAIAVRGFDEYRPSLESMFDYYGVPLFVTRKSDMLSKPIPSLVLSAYDIVTGGWETDDVLSYIRTGLVGLSTEACDELENYVLLWRMRGTGWYKVKNWNQHPEGFDAEYTDAVNEKLARINKYKNRICEPLIKFAQSSEKATTASEQAVALSELLQDIKLPNTLMRRAEELRATDRAALADEYVQIWDLIVNALEQASDILGEMEMDARTFGKMFMLVLSQYDIGTIPVSIDRVSAGDFDRMRRRNIQHLIVLGASDDKLPASNEQTGVFSAEDRKELLELELDLGDCGEEGLWREFSLIYNTLTLPKKTLTMCYGASAEGNGRPSFIMNRAASMFGIEIKEYDKRIAKMNAKGPAMELAAGAVRSSTPETDSARKYFETEDNERLEKIHSAAQMTRGSLSNTSVKSLYGDTVRMSASRIDKLSQCKFSYFLQYGLKAKSRKPAGFNPPEIGTFMHYILQNTAEEVKKLGGFANVDSDKVSEITDKYIDLYVKEKLNGFEEKNGRFIHLFNRLKKDVHTVVNDMAEELRKSKFEPLDFELDFGTDERLPTVTVGEGDNQLVLTGIADRVDGWINEGKMYLRVVDYKTGTKKFDLSDIWYGMGLQMLLYLFNLEKSGQTLYGHEIVPAGVLYVPAKDVNVLSDSNISDEKINEERIKKLKRSGLILSNPDVIRAMEEGEPVYLPVKTKDGLYSGDSLVSTEQLGKLSKHINETLREMTQQLNNGKIDADPYYKSSSSNACRNCEFADICHFNDGDGTDNLRYLAKLKAEQVWEKLEGGEQEHE